jgi:hypothetical protein
MMGYARKKGPHEDAGASGCNHPGMSDPKSVKRSGQRTPEEKFNSWAGDQEYETSTDADSITLKPMKVRTLKCGCSATMAVNETDWRPVAGPDCDFKHGRYA